MSGTLNPKLSPRDCRESFPVTYPPPPKKKKQKKKHAIGYQELSDIIVRYVESFLLHSHRSEVDMIRDVFSHE